MTVELEVQRAASGGGLPSDADFLAWVEVALADRPEAMLTIRIVGLEESRSLNRRYRDRDAPTNVLSFAAELPPDIGLPLLGDIVICAPLVDAEARAQGKPVGEHWAHLTVHGVLHLLGHDHQQADEAEIMEALEVRLLAGLGIADPYA